MSKHNKKKQEYAQFSRAMDLPQQRARVTVDGLGNIGVGKTSGGTGHKSPIEAEKVGAKVTKAKAVKLVGLFSEKAFVPAKTIDEAQEYAKKYINTETISKTFGGMADFKGIDVENANKINKALTDVYSKIDIDKISGIKVISPTSKLGKKAFKDGSDAVFSYSPVEHGIYVNKDILKNSKAFEDYVSRSEKAWNDVMQNIDKLTGSNKELALTYKNAGRSLVDGKTVDGMFTHELGHHAQWTLLDSSTNNSVGKRMSEFAPKISGYANASKSEYLAESFSAYMKGEKTILDPEYVRYLDKKINNHSVNVVGNANEYVRNGIGSLKTIKLNPKEFEHVTSEIATNLTEEQKHSIIISKPIGNYVYTVENRGFGDYRVIGKKPIRSTIKRGNHK